MARGLSILVMAFVLMVSLSTHAMAVGPEGPGEGGTVTITNWSTVQQVANSVSLGNSYANGDTSSSASGATITASAWAIADDNLPNGVPVVDTQSSAVSIMEVKRTAVVQYRGGEATVVFRSTATSSYHIYTNAGTTSEGIEGYARGKVEVGGTATGPFGLAWTRNATLEAGMASAQQSFPPTNNSPQPFGTSSWSSGLKEEEMQVLTNTDFTFEIRARAVADTLRRYVGSTQAYSMADVSVTTVTSVEVTVSNPMQGGN